MRRRLDADRPPTSELLRARVLRSWCPTCKRTPPDLYFACEHCPRLTAREKARWKDGLAG